ncbi:hypothetical protein VNI00_009374 [Paramarasmius palmivorus]|uniref:Protein kinase domain-containing protein n=1 Tax=Paramarasmius palmivorus TaxID=297713 RepID=A0AAW0CTL7_9AGAR
MIDFAQWIYDIVAGLAYLHSHVPMIVHGDIKGANILVDDSLHCRLADFGLAAMTNESEQVFTSTTTGGVKGSFRWMAPELYQTGDTGLRLRGSSKSSRDMYAYGCTALEIITGRPPFPDLLDAQVMFRVLSGRRPERPQDAWCPNNIWDLIERCWDTNPFRRPSASVVHVFLEQLLASRETSDTAADSETEHMFLPTWDLVDNEEHADDSLTSPLTPVADANKATASQSGLTARDSELPPAYSSIVMPDDPGSIQPWLLDQQMQPKTWTPHTSIEGNDHFDLGRKSPPPPEYQTHHSHKASPNAGDPTDQYTSTATLEDATPHAHHVSSSAMHTTFSDPVLSSPSYNSVTVGDAIVQRTYVPNLADGLAVTIDDTVRVLKTYHDGWALCEDSQQLLGMVPMEILEQTKSKTQDVGIDHGIARSASPNVLVLNSLEPLEEPPEVYCGWLSSLIQPLKRFITPANDFKDYYYDLQEISDTINGSVFLAKARIERISHTFLSKFHQPSVAKQTMVAIRCIFLVPSWTSALEELKHELSTLDGLSHANIHRIDALYIDFLDDSLWIRTELMKCRLSHILELVSKGIILREDAIATATADLVQALGFLRDHNIAHRNVKAENIWVNYDGVLKLGGFSESKCILAGADTWSPGGDRENSWQAPETLGSPGYYDPFKADIWSLGAIIYAFTQKNPALYSPKLDKFQRLCWYLPEDRPDIKSLAQHDFLIRSLSNGRGDLVELIKAHA